MSLHRVPPTPDMAAASLQPLVVIARRELSAAAAVAARAAPPVQLVFKHTGGGPDAEHVREIVQARAGDTGCKSRASR